MFIKFLFAYFIFFFWVLVNEPRASQMLIKYTLLQHQAQDPSNKELLPKL
jgi:hypothetical protein